MTEFVLTLSCPDRPGIVAAVSGLLARRGGNITESQQFGDRDTGRFFMRVQFTVDPAGSAAPAGPREPPVQAARPTGCGPRWPSSRRSSAWTGSCMTPRSGRASSSSCPGPGTA